jgi:hypothetical protein
MLQGEKIFLVDFGFCDKFVDKYGRHLGKDYVMESFRGNFTFATSRQLEFKKPSRRDDLISLGYLLVYLLNDNKLPIYSEVFQEKSLDQYEELAIARIFKKQNSLTHLATIVDPSLEEFCREIEQLGYDQRPDYVLL